MDVLTVRHLTVFRYARPVRFGEHRMMFRPRESFDQHVLDFSLTISPQPAELRYVHDVFGNCIGIATFARPARRLRFDSRVRLQHSPEHALALPGSSGNQMNSYPFSYAPTDLPDLSSSMACAHPDPDGLLDAWSRRFVECQPKVDALHVLTAMTKAIHTDLKYVSRPTGLPQSPLETLTLRGGTCRDFAVLMIEAVRRLGMACRFVSGYLHIPGSERGRLGGGNTHAWVRVFLPDGGWAEFDPTNGLVGNKDLIRVAVVRDPTQATPLWGTWDGKAADYLGMDVTVDVTAH